jgi:hypothetical protein
MVDTDGVQVPRSASLMSSIAAAALVMVLMLMVAPIVVAAPTPVDGPASVTEVAVRLTPPTVRPGNPNGVPLPSEAGLVDTSRPDRVIGAGTAASCTSQGVVDAVAAGGVITFDCGSDAVTIDMAATAKVVNTSQVVVLDGGGLVTLSGGDQRRILYMNTCDRAQIWTTSHCQNQDHPQLTIQRMTFTRGNSSGQSTGLTGGGGGGAVFVRGGQVKVLESAFMANRCESTGPDVGGGALRVFSQYDSRAVIVANSTFGGSVAGGNQCSNGAATSSIGVSWRIYNSLFTHNNAVGRGANPQRPGTPGGGNGGAIYLDGNEMQLELIGSIVQDNTANEGGGGIFFVSNNRTGTIRINQSMLVRNLSRGFETSGLPGIFYLGNGDPMVTATTIR